MDELPSKRRQEHTSGPGEARAHEPSLRSAGSSYRWARVAIFPRWEGGLDRRRPALLVALLSVRTMLVESVQYIQTLKSSDSQTSKEPCL